jgi:hypothetical protein
LLSGEETFSAGESVKISDSPSFDLTENGVLGLPPASMRTLLLILAAALCLNASAADEIILGIGGITSKLDQTTESFNLHQFLQTNVVTVSGAVIRPKLVDAPADAPYAITGYFDDDIRMVRDRGRGQKMYFRYTSVFHVKVWANGRKVKELSLDSSGVTKPAVYTPADLRVQCVMPAFRKLADELPKILPAK